MSLLLVRRPPACAVCKAAWAAEAVEGKAGRALLCAECAVKVKAELAAEAAKLN